MPAAWNANRRRLRAQADFWNPTRCLTFIKLLMLASGDSQVVENPSVSSGEVAVGPFLGPPPSRGEDHRLGRPAHAQLGELLRRRRVPSPHRSIVKGPGHLPGPPRD